MMLKLLVGLFLATAITGNAVNPQRNVDPRQRTNCENPEVLLKLRTILSGLLGPDGKSIKVPDVAQIKYALTLINISLEEYQAQNYEPTKKLQHLENEWAQNKDKTLDEKIPLRSLLDANAIKNDLSSNMLFRNDLPSNIKPSCKSAFLNLIHVAQEAYVNMAKSPVCTNENAEPLVPNAGDFAYNAPTGQPHQYPYNSALLSPSEEALKKVTEYLKAPENYNSNNVMSLLQSLQSKVPHVSPLNYELNSYAQPKIKSNVLNYGQNHASTKLQDITSKGNTNAANLNSPLQGDFNLNLEHAKDIYNKLYPHNLYKNESPDATKSNTNQPNGQPTLVDGFYLNVGGALNYPPNKQMSQADLQIWHHMPVENGNNANAQNYLNPQKSQHNLYQSPQYIIDPYQNQANFESNKMFKPFEQPNNVADNSNNNLFYQEGYNNPGSNHNIYQNALPNKQLPIGLPWAFNSNNNIGIDKQSNDASGIANAAKLETTIRPKGQVELTYLLKRKRPLIYQPFYFVKYRLPYNYFVQNLRQMLSLEPNLVTPPTELYKGLIAPTNATEVSSDLASYPKEEIHNLVLKDGALVKAKYIEPNDTEENDTTRNSDRDSSEVNFADGDVEQNGERGSSENELNSNPLEQNIPLLNEARLNLPYPVLNQAVGKQAALYRNPIPLSQENQTLAKLLAALGLKKLLVKEPILAESSQVNVPNAVENQASYHQEVPLHNTGNQQPVLNHLYSPYKEMHQAASSQLNPPYLIDNQAVQKNPYVTGSQAVPSQKLSSYIHEQLGQKTPLANVGYQFVRPPYVAGVASQSALSQIGPMQSPYVVGTQAALGLNNKFVGNNVISNSLHALRQPRRLLGGFFNPNQYAYNRPGLYPNNLGTPFSATFGNQGLLGQPTLDNQLGIGLGQPYLYGQRPVFG